MRRLRLRLVPTVLLLALAAALEGTGVDLQVLDACFSAARGAFIARGTGWGDTLLHDGAARAILFAAVGLLMLRFVATENRRLKPYRGDLDYLLLCVVLSTGLVAVLKHFSPVPCPVQWQRYGGGAEGINVLQSMMGRATAASSAGHCFPGGHSSGAWAWLGLYWVARRRHPAAAWPVLCGVTTMGLLFSATQWLRGAHFPSHDVCSAALAWLVASSLDQLRPAVDRDRQAQYDAGTGRVIDDLAVPVMQQHHGPHQR